MTTLLATFPAFARLLSGVVAVEAEAADQNWEVVDCDLSALSDPDQELLREAEVECAALSVRQLKAYANLDPEDMEMGCGPRWARRLATTNDLVARVVGDGNYSSPDVLSRVLVPARV